METLRRQSDDILTGALLAGAAGVVLAFLAFTTGVYHDSTRTVAYTHDGAWSYQAPVPDTSLFASGQVQTGEPIFSKLSQEATFSFAYRGTSEVPADVTGEGRLVAEVRESSGWSWLIPMGTAVRFQGMEATLAGRLDLAELAAVTDRFREGTGATRAVFEVVVRPDLSVSVAAAGNVVRGPFNPELPFRYDSAGLIPLKANGGAAPPRRTDTIPLVARARNTIPLLAWKMDVKQARMLGLTLLEAAVLGLIVVVVVRADPRTAAARKPAVDERRLVAVRAFPAVPGTRVVEVDSLEELGRIATFEDAMILVKRGRAATEYAVVGVGAMYVLQEAVLVHRARFAA